VCAFTVVRRVFEQGAYADRALTAEASGLDRRDRPLAMQLSYGTVQRRATLDHVAERLSNRRVGDIDPPALAALRLGLYQLLYLDGVADHAVVNDSVELSKHANRGATRLVNAVLRRAAREGRSLLEGIDDGTPSGAALRYSVPEWLAELWWRELGATAAHSLLATVNRPAEAALRVNTLAANVEEVLEQLGVRASPAPELPEGLMLHEPLDVYDTDLWRAGAIMPQSRGSMLVSRLLDPQPGERVLDLCAAPGAKTTHLAALIENEGAVLAVERHAGRAQALQRTCSRMGASCAQIEVSDAAEPRRDDYFDRVLVDPPCSGLGTLQSRPDIRWRASPARLGDLAALQARILLAGAMCTRPGGTLVYSVCTISRAESEGVIEGLLRTRSEFVLESQRQLLPDREGTDGFFIARLRRGDG
jgi:16S rRNA (cytosine967-C5)-methyltransferase